MRLPWRNTEKVEYLRKSSSRMLDNDKLIEELSDFIDVYNEKIQQINLF